MFEINHIDSPAGWDSKTLNENSPKWQYQLTLLDQQEIDNALTYLKSKQTDNYVFNSSYFPLPKLQRKLKEISKIVESGFGVFLLRGIPVEKYSNSDLKLIYSGIGLYFGRLIAQSKTGELIGDVGDTGKALTDKTGRGTTTKDPLPFHTDRCDVVTLFCLRQCKSGGQSRIASAIAIHNEIKEKHPKLIKLLYQPYHHARAAWETDGQNLFYPLPIFSNYQGYFAMRYLRHFTNIAQEINGVPKMSLEQIQALDLIEHLASQPKFCAEIDFKPGDIQIVNNFVILHSRAGYEDDKHNKRHLLRLWLSTPNSRPLSQEFKPLYGNTKAGALRGGIPTHEMETNTEKAL